MVTNTQINYIAKELMHFPKPFGIGNQLFEIAGVIGIATKNGYSYGFDWPNQEYFEHSLPKKEQREFPIHAMPRNYKLYDIGFLGFDVPDNVDLYGLFGSEKYFKHCENLIRYYFTFKEMYNPYSEWIVIHYRDYGIPEFTYLDHEYYTRALKHFPKTDIVVITNNVEAARKAIKIDCEYVKNSPITDLALMSQAIYLIISNSTFSWWGAWLSKARVVAPLHWYGGSWRDCPTKDLYCDGWILE